jgi:hypothetical protein
MKFTPIAALLALCAASLAHAAPVSIDAASLTSYSQNFNSLAGSGTPAWTNDSTLAGWSLFNSTGSAVASLVAADGSGNTGSFYSYGATGSSDRALGGLGSGGSYFGSPASGALAGYIALALKNTGSTGINSFTLSFDGEQWRNGGNTTKQTATLQYGFGSSFAAVSSWTAAGSAFNFTSPIATATAAGLDGNAAANRVAGLGGTVTTNWAAGQTLWLRWIENNDSGNDHGLAIDNLSFSVPAAAVVPEPSSTAAALAGLAAVGFLARRRKAA